MPMGSMGNETLGDRGDYVATNPNGSPPQCVIASAPVKGCMNVPQQAIQSTLVPEHNTLVDEGDGDVAMTTLEEEVVTTERNRRTGSTLKVVEQPENALPVAAAERTIASRF